MQRLLFIVNPNSGKGEMRHQAIDCIDRFVKAGYEVTVYTTQQSGDATRIVVDRGSAFDLIVCSGGDGTLNECVGSWMKNPHSATSPPVRQTILQTVSASPKRLWTRRN